jgi:hypothetical protein
MMGWLLCEAGSKLAQRVGASNLAQAQTAGQSPGQVKRGLRANAAGHERPGTQKRRYFCLRAPDFLAARKEIPARMAFCWTAAAVRPSCLATALVGVPALASCFRVFSSPALQEEPSFEGRFAISLLSNHTQVGHPRMIAADSGGRAPNMVY